MLRERCNEVVDDEAIDVVNKANSIAYLSEQALTDNGIALFEGSNAWSVSGTRTKSGKPLLAGDPHISFAVPAVWYEAHLSYPGFELYGHHQALRW